MARLCSASKLKIYETGRSESARRLGVRSSNAMNRLITSTAIPARAVKIEALANMTASFESFCLASGIEALAEMMENDARTACGPRHARGKNRRAHGAGKTKSK